MALAGLRPSELCGFRVRDVDWDDHTISVNEVRMWVKGELVVKGPQDRDWAADDPPSPTG